MAPKVEEQFNPDRTILTLSFIEKQAEKTSRNEQAAKTAENKQRIIDYLTKEGGSRAADIAGYVGLSPARVRVLLFELSEEGRVRTEGNGRARRYLPELVYKSIKR